MNRREALTRVGFILGGTVIGANAFTAGLSPKAEFATEKDFTPDVVSFLDEVGETILPTTASSPGAKEAKIGEFMKLIVTDCYSEEEQAAFMGGITKIKELSKEKYKKDFMKLSVQERHTLLVELDIQAKEAAKTKGKDDVPHYFGLMKQLTLWGYFSSEVGAKKALRYNPIPGKFEGCIDYKKGDKLWSEI